MSWRLRASEYMKNIYLITNQVNGKQYVGKTKQDIHERLKQHKWSNYDTLLHLAIKEHGIENFTVELLEAVADKESIQKEKEYTIAYNTLFPNGYNQMIGQSLSGGNNKMKGKHLPETWRKNCSRVGETNGRASIYKLIWKDTKEEIILKKVTEREVKPVVIKDDIIVEGIDSLKVNVANCCQPIPGDHIVGYITKGNGISVHRMSCPNMEQVEERVISVHWNETVSKKYHTSLLIEAENTKNVLLDIISKTSSGEIIVDSINTLKRSGDTSLIEVTIRVSNLEKLTKFIHDLESLKHIITVERLIK